VGFLFFGLKSKHGIRHSFLATEKTMGVPEIRAEDLKRRLDAGEDLFLLDVRDEFEFETSNIGGHLRADAYQIPSNLRR
jgi:hypothetical protein